MGYGRIILTSAVFAIVITVPIGAALINTLGVKWLSKDLSEDRDGPEIEL